MLARHLWAPIGVLCFPSVLFAQTPEFHYLHGGHAHGIQCVDDTPMDRCVNVGDGGRIRYSVDGGVTWTDSEVDPNYRGHFRQVFILDINNMWAVGEGGAVHRSTDKGVNWTWLNPFTPVLDQSPPPKPADLYDIWMTSTSVGWLVGKDGVVRKTSDGGNSWSEPTIWARPDSTAPTSTSGCPRRTPTRSTPTTSRSSTPTRSSSRPTGA